MATFQITLLITLIATASTTLNSIQGTVSYPLTERCEDILIRLDGDMLVCSHFWLKNI